MKIINSSKNDTLRVFPDSLLSEEQAQSNHSQSLKRLNERGGLSYSELYLNIMSLPLSYFKYVDKLPIKNIIEHTVFIFNKNQLPVDESEKLSKSDSLKIQRRDIKKEQPTEYQVCMIFPHWIKAEWVDDGFYSSNGRESYYGVKTWVPVGELREIMVFDE